MKTKKSLSALALLATLALSTTACGGGGRLIPPPLTPSPTDGAAPTSSPSTNSTPLKKQSRFMITGNCDTEHGTLIGAGSGFTPNARYQTIVDYTGPNGVKKPYTDFQNVGVFSEFGTTPTWSWPCVGGPAGDYDVTILDFGPVDNGLSEKPTDASDGFTILPA